MNELSSESFVSWRHLETLVGLDGLAKLHRALLRFVGVAEADALPLRRAQQRAEAELNRLARAGQLQKTGGDWLLPEALIRQFYAKPAQGATPLQISKPEQS